MLTSQTREIDRMDDPSQSMARIWVRLSNGSLFILKLCLTEHVLSRSSFAVTLNLLRQGIESHGSAIEKALRIQRETCPKAGDEAGEREDFVRLHQKQLLSVN